MHRTGGTLLVISTDPELLQALSQALSLNEYVVNTAKDWSEALGCLDWLPLSVMVYDVKELDQREWERLAALRKEHPDLPAILLASLKSRELDWAVTEGLIAGYLMKPVQLTALEACLEKVGAERQGAGA